MGLRPVKSHQILRGADSLRADSLGQVANHGLPTAADWHARGAGKGAPASGSGFPTLLGWAGGRRNFMKNSMSLRDFHGARGGFSPLSSYGFVAEEEGALNRPGMRDPSLGQQLISTSEYERDSQDLAGDAFLTIDALLRFDALWRVSELRDGVY